MKEEIQRLDKKKIEYIQKKYKVNRCYKVDSNLKNEMREQFQRYKMILFYKEGLDSGNIKEEDIPIEYVEEIRKLYQEGILEIQRKIKLLIKGDKK